MSYKAKSPVVIIIFQRPELTEKLVSKIGDVRPKDLFIIADGPKNKTEGTLCAAARKAAEKIDWDCQVHKIYSSKNMGLRKRVVTGLNQVFEQVDRAIILEDDCIPSEHFFKFCDQMLIKYKDHSNVTTISGNNFLFNKLAIDESYYFSRYPLIWGWATWKRAWKIYDDELLKWPNYKSENALLKIFSNQAIASYWTYIFDKVAGGYINSWAYRWTYSNLFAGGMTIIPSKNLVSNIGYGAQSTHTFFKSRRMGMPTDTLEFPLHHPKQVKLNHKADKIVERTTYLTMRNRIIKLFKNIIGV
jgi:GR25 family glycosyltransferase involved in LPS biosynthesis